MHVATGKWLAENTPGDAVVACNDVGAIGYFSNRHVLDLLGLVTPEVVAYRKKQPVGRENLGGLEYIRAKRPDYLVIFPDWFPNLKNSRFLQPVYAADVPDNTACEWDFEPKLRTTAGVLITDLHVEPARSTMVVFKCDWTQELNPVQ
jgi:arabinofuranosyltransferase